jgi:hypothetical protein
MPAELLDDVGLLYGADGCLTDQASSRRPNGIRKGWP